MTEETYEALPKNIKAIVDSVDLDLIGNYDECARIKSELEEVGWTCDYDLSGEIFDIKKNKHECNTGN